ncbi:unnamed protein product [Peronospora destructor]|uniref:Uncharacterized protein n=1 Tax=Peronospora destructor TaxID=86335 RepID=A0AAV0UF45_9STRA|nr:unnamed protein product [Peronospora destructor]
MEHSSARELLRASATDADAVRHYLQSIETDDLDGLLDGIALRSIKNKTKSVFLVQDDWLPLVRLSVQCEATRLRATSRIIQVLRLGSPSELESMQLLTEVNIGYSNALDELQDRQMTTRQLVQRRKLLDEIEAVLNMVFSFLEDVVSSKEKGKVLPQLLGLVLYFLGLIGEISGRDISTVTENLTNLLEMPWSFQTVSSLLNALVNDTSLMGKESWQQLQENVERMVTTSPEMASETMNPIIRECVLVANVTGDHKWIGTARYLLRQLPVYLRQEAEFNLQMSFNQSPRIVSLVCQSIRSSKKSERHDAVMKEASSQCDGPQGGTADLLLDWRDLFLLLHSLQTSKPILHHRTSFTRVATEASVFTEIEQLAWVIVHSDFKAFESSASSTEISSQELRKTVAKHVLDQVELVLNFGGKQIYAREWKALLLMDIALFWLEKSSPTRDVNKIVLSKSTSALMLLQAIFETAPETRSEVFSSLFERSQHPVQRKIAGETLSRLFISQSGKLFPHLNAIQDWLSMQFQRSFDSARDFFLIASRLATVYKDLYNFLMVFLRKLLSTGKWRHQKFAVDMWCTWLDHRLPFNEQQEEEIVSALKNSVIASRDIQAWSFGRLEQVFRSSSATVDGPAISLRKSSWEELHRFFSQEVGKFILPTTGIVGFENEDVEVCANEYDDEDSGLPRFRFSSLDAFYQQNASLDGAASTGLVFQKLLSCLVTFEKGIFLSKISSEGLPIEGLSENDSDIKQWLVDLVSNWKYFFHWICQDSDQLLNQSAQGRACEKSSWWKLVARVYIGCAICNITLDMLMWNWSAENSSERDTDNEGLTAFDTDNCEISVWSLMEMEFSLHRMIQKLASHYGNEMETNLSKEFVRSASYGLHRALQPAKLNILTAIKSTLQRSGALKAADLKQPNGMSFDAVLFALDSCYSTHGDEGLFGALCPWVSEDDGLSEASSILEVLLCVYTIVRNRIVPGSNVSGADNVRLGGKEMDESACRQRFSLYADSISAKFPASARHLILPGKSAKPVVLLDTKSGEEMLEHVCAAIGRTLETMIKSTGLHSVHDELGQVLSNLSWTGSREIQAVGGKNNFACLSRNILVDAEKCIQLNGLTKLAVSCASLGKRLLGNAADMVHLDCSTDYSDFHKLSSLAYDILCDNVVYNARLLRLLMNICLPTHLALRIETFVALESKIEGIVQTCLINSAEAVDASTATNHQRRSALRALKEKRDGPARRKRLRQGFDARSSYDLSEDSDFDSDFDSDASYSSDSEVSDDANAIINSHTSGSRRNQDALPNRDRIPHLHSRATQSIAIVAVLTLLEQSQSSLLNAITAKNGSGEPISFPHYQEILGYNRIHGLVNKLISDYRDLSWETRNVLLKVLHMIELGLRIGKASGSLQRKGADPEVGTWHDSTISIYESSVTSALRSRAWVGGIKDASRDSVTKTKATISDATKERLKAIVTMVKERIAPTEHSSVRYGKEKARQRLIGVVPIVRKRKKRLRSRHPVIDAFLNEEDGADAFADLEDFIE